MKKNNNKKEKIEVKKEKPFASETKNIFTGKVIKGGLSSVTVDKSKE